MIDPGLAHRTALVTGANQGIGAAVALALAAQGAAVLVSYLRLDPAVHAGDPAFPEQYGNDRAAPADHVLERIRAGGGRAHAVEADLRDPGVVPGLFDYAEATLGPVDILVNNASGWLANTFRPGRVDRFGRTIGPVDQAAHERQFAVDARAPALLIAEYAARHVRRGASGGRIIGLTSGGRNGFPEEVSYGAAKAAQESYTISAAQELGEYGVTANMVHPPVTDTGWVTDSVAAAATAASPLRHIAKPEDVAEVVVFLASEQGRFVTGQIIVMS